MEKATQHPSQIENGTWYTHIGKYKQSYCEYVPEMWTIRICLSVWV